MKKLFTILISTCVIACGSTSVYDNVASKLLTGDRSGGYGYDGSFYPKGSTEDHHLTNQQRVEFRKTIVECVNSLKSDNSILVYKKINPSEVIATAQLIECMNSKGWVLHLEEILITSQLTIACKSRLDATCVAPVI